MRQVISKVLYNRRLSASYYKMGLACKEVPNLAIPGQFVMVRVSSHCDPLLGRPFCIYRIIDEPEGFEILYKVVGKGTSILQEKSTGDRIELIGPLGNGFDLKGLCKDTLIVAGGIGIASFYFFIEMIMKERAAFPRITLEA